MTSTGTSKYPAILRARKDWVLAPFYISDRLVMDTQRLAELPSRDAPLGAEHGDAVVNLVRHLTHCAAS
jgi:hypothetical protein